MSILKQGEINAIMNNFEVVKNNGKLEGKMGNNSIHLASSHENRISLRTNGLVVYGVYYHGEEKIRFTHDFRRFPKPFVKCDNYADLKQVILNAWKKTFDEKAQAKLEEVKNLVQQLLTKQQETIAKYNAQQEPEAPQTNTNKNTIEKKEVKEMNKNTNIETKTEVKELHVMKVAHLIRRELKLEGHYYVQMKIAMELAWKIKRGLITLDALLNNDTEISAAEATDTYDAAPVVEEETTAKEESVQEPIVDQEFSYKVYLKSMKNGIAEFFMKRSDGAEKPFYKTKARNLVDLDKQFAKVLQVAISKCYDNTVLEYYGQYTYLTFCRTEALRDHAASRNITLVQGVAPSGDVA